jgi:hypothetical protein
MDEMPVQVIANIYDLQWHKKFVKSEQFLRQCNYLKSWHKQYRYKNMYEIQFFLQKEQ